MIRRPPRSTLFPTRRSSDLLEAALEQRAGRAGIVAVVLERLAHRFRNDGVGGEMHHRVEDRKSTRLNSSHGYISYAVFCLKKKKPNISLTTLFPTLPCAYTT